MNCFLTGKSDKQAVQALLMCKQVSGLDVLFTNLLEETKTSLIKATDTVVIHRLQGRAEVLSDFLEAMKDAPSIMERFR
jgi:hypothetical protein